MKDRKEPETANIVKFPERGERTKVNFDLTGDDPLESLLQEFEEISKDLDDHIYEKDSSIMREAFNKLPTTATDAILPEDILAKEFSQALEFQTRIDLLHEVNKRIKFYLDEVELFLPKKN